LARILAPATAQDPVAYDTAVDPSLRELFGFGEPLPPPAEPEPPPADSSFLHWLLASAWAADIADIPVTARLNRWVPAREEVPEYLVLVRDLINNTSELTLATKNLNPQFHK